MVGNILIHIPYTLDDTTCTCMVLLLITAIMVFWALFNLVLVVLKLTYETHVPISNLLDVSFSKWWSWKTSLYTLAGIMLTLAHVSSLDLRYSFLLWCGFYLYVKLVIRWDVVGILVLACAHCILTCKQKDSLLEVKSSDWPHMESSFAYTCPACSWWALGALDLKYTCFWKHKLVKCLHMWQDLHWNLLAGHLKPSTCLESPYLEHLSLLVWACLGSNFFL